MAETVVIGAGIVGLATALALRSVGQRVTVIDRLAPGEACSFGNSGGMPRGHAYPLATLGIIRQVPSYLLDPLGPLAIRPRHLPVLTPWLRRFVQASRPKAFTSTLDHLTALMRQGYDAWSVVLDQIGGRDLVREDGALTLYRRVADRDAAETLWRMFEARGAALHRLDEAALRAQEPAAPPGYACAMFQPDYRRTVDPYGLCCAMAVHFQGQGGVIRRETVSEVVPSEAPAILVRTNHGEHRADTVVIAAGAWSNRFTEALGHAVPLEAARGYHVTLLDPGIMPRHALFISDFRVSMTPMRMGLRIGGNVEFAGLDAPPNFARAQRQIEVARRIYPGIRTEAHTKWAGERPATPDSLPVIGPLPRHPRVICAFGHGQYGLALAAVTGQIVRDLVIEGRPAPAAFAADRWHQVNR